MRLIMGKIVLVFVVVGLAVAHEEGVCDRKHGEIQEITEMMPKMWSVCHKLNCSRENIDAATVTPDGKTYFFKDEFYWRMNDADVDPGYPRLITQDWDGLPGHLDAALTWTDGRTFFFKGRVYWSFHGMKMDYGYPRYINVGFSGIPDNLDAAAMWSNNRAYFFKGDQYWRFDGAEFTEPVKGHYPLSISEWAGVPPNVDAAVRWRNGQTYFLKGDEYYRYDDKDNRVDRKAKIDGNWGVNCSELNCRIPGKLRPEDSYTCLFVQWISQPYT